MYEFHLFAGIGGGILGGVLAGNICVGAVEIEEYPRKVLIQRQIDGCLPIFPVWDDVRTFREDNEECSWFIKYLKSIRNELCICGGFPCQDISIAGKGAGIDGKRSGLWKEFKRIICEIRPKYAFIENSPMLTVRGGTRVIADITEIGYDVRWDIISAESCGAWHRRERMWMRCVLNTNSIGSEKSFFQDGKFYEEEKETFTWKHNGTSCENHVYDSWMYWNEQRKRKLQESEQTKTDGSDNGGGEEIVSLREWWEAEPKLGRVADGIPNRMERLKAIGNAQVPVVAARAFGMLKM